MTWKQKCDIRGEGSLFGFNVEASTWFAWQWVRNHQSPCVLVVPSMKRYHEAIEYFACFNSTLQIPIQVFGFPEIDVKYHLQLQPDVSRYAERAAAMNAMLFPTNPLHILITTPWALAQPVHSSKIWKDHCLEFSVSSPIDLDYLKLILMSGGYEHTDLVEAPGTFSVRGFTIDIFSPNFELPIRIELFDVSIETIKFFQPQTQRTVSTIENVRVVPYRPVILSDETEKTFGAHVKDYCDRSSVAKQHRERIQHYVENKVHFKGIDGLLSYFDPGIQHFSKLIPSNSQFFIADPGACFKELERVDQDYEKGLDSLPEECRVLRPFETSIKTLPEWMSLVPKDHTVTLAAVGYDGESTTTIHADTNTAIRSQLNPATPILFEEKMSRFRKLVHQLLGESFEVFIALSGETQRRRVQHMLDPVPDGAHLLNHDVPRGFRISEAHVIFLSEEDIFGKRKRAAPKNTTPQLNVTDLNPGDYVAHIDHGIAKFLSLKRMTFGSLEGEFLVLSYKDGDLLYLPVDRMNLISRFADKLSPHVVLDKLGATRWEKAKQKARQAARDLAAQLIDHYAQRQLAHGPVIQPSEIDYEHFESLFPFEETDDQLSAIESVSKDLSSNKPSDRLICGDVGFGKTEVAMRAAFRTVSAGKQVAVLVPTTLLCLQHEESFKERFKGFPVTIHGLSRFQSSSQADSIIQSLQDGSTHIVIGTHRLLSKDVKFKDLGLMVIDEEQKFGVLHKERLRELRHGVHTITLTATPIPRTLHLSFMGLRDMSLINTPPTNRLAVRTYVCGFDENILKEAMESELKRGGQVFVVRPKVMGIEEVTQSIRTWLPKARVEWAHGQMNEHLLEKRMISFYQHEIDILVSTTIIESGLDVPNANTMIILDADHFGLSQLYQLRGRIGRSNVRGYCYLTVPSLNTLTPDAKRRLQVLQSHSDLGSGLTVAHYDLDLRGSGEILGEKQSGHLQTIGLDAYLDLLHQAVLSLRGEPPPAPEPEINVRAVALFSEEYIPDVLTRMRLYRRLSNAQSLEIIDDFRSELEDRFGPLPPESDHMLLLSKCRWLCKHLHVVQVSSGPHKIAFRFSEQGIEMHSEYLLHLVKKNSKKYKPLPDGRLAISLDKEVISLEDLYDQLLGFWEQGVSR